MNFQVSARIRLIFAHTGSPSQFGGYMSNEISVASKQAEAADEHPFQEDRPDHRGHDVRQKVQQRDQPHTACCRIERQAPAPARSTSCNDDARADDDDGVEQVAPEAFIAEQVDIVGESDELRGATAEIVAQETIVDRRGERIGQHNGHHREAGHHEQPHGVRALLVVASLRQHGLAPRSPPRRAPPWSPSARRSPARCAC